MLTLEMTSTTANPSITLPRNRSVGSFIVGNFKPNPDLPATLPTKDGSGSAKLPSPMPRINAELIKGRKFEHIGDPPQGSVVSASGPISSPGIEAVAQSCALRFVDACHRRSCGSGCCRSGALDDTATKFLVAKSRGGASNRRN